MELLWSPLYVTSFLPVCADSKTFKIWRRALVVAILKPVKPVGDPKSYRPISLVCVPYKIVERHINTRVEPLIDPPLPKEQAGLRCGRSTVDQDVWPKISRILLRLRRRPVPYLSIWQLLMTLFGTVAFCKLLRFLPDKHIIRIITEFLSETAVSPLPPVTASKADYAVLKTAFLRNRSWLPFYLTSIRTIFLP